MAAIFKAKALFPIAGLPAKTTKSDFCKPAKRLSSPKKPVGIPLKVPLSLCNLSILSKDSVKMDFMGMKFSFKYFWETPNNFCSALSKITSISSSSSRAKEEISEAADINFRKVDLWATILA